MGFTQRLKELRTERNLTQKDLAQRLGFSKNAVCEWEKSRCEPSITVLIQLSKVLNVSIDYLVGNSDEFGTITVDGPILTEPEKQLLSCFRVLESYQQETVLTQVKALAKI